MQQYDAIVVGAGPAGSATATLLAQAGVRVLVLDRAYFPRRKPCAEYASPGAAAILAELGVLVPTDGRRLRGMTLIAPSGRSHLVCYGNGAEAPRSLSVSREVLDAALVARARAAGAEVREG